MDLPERQKTTAAPLLSATDSAQISLGAIARPLAAAALLSALIGRGLAPALPGTTDGLDSWIVTIGLVGAALSQLTAILGATFGALLMVTTLWQRQFPYAYRLIAMPTGAAALTLVALSTRQTLSPGESLGLALCATLLAGASALLSVRKTETRAVGLVLGFAAAAAAGYSSARGLAWIDTALHQDDWRTAASALATAAWGLDLLCLVLATTALLTAHRSAVVRAAAAAALVVAGAFAWTGSRGALDGASFVEVLSSRALSEFTPGPGPMIPGVLRFFTEGYAIALTGLLVVTGRRIATAQIALALIVLCRASPEIPACALLLVIASVLAPLGIQSPDESARGSTLAATQQ